MDNVTECPGPDSRVEGAMKKIKRVMSGLRTAGRATNEQMFRHLKSAMEDLQASMDESHRIHANESEINEIKKLAGIVEFADMNYDSDSGGSSQPRGVPLWQRLKVIASNAQGVGRIDQQQIEEIFRAAEILKKMNK